MDGVLSAGVTERSDFPAGLPVAQFETPDSAHEAVAVAFPLARPTHHWRAWIYGRRVAWVGTAPDDATHQDLAGRTGEYLRVRWAQHRAVTN